MLGMKVIAQELLSIKFIWSCRTIIIIIGETLVAYHSRKVEKWDQLFSDVTGRRQNALQNFVISVINEERLRPLILSSSIFLKGKTSEQQVDALISTIAVYRKRFQRWVEVLDHSHPSYQKYFSELSSMNINKLGIGGDLMSDTCNGARKTQRLIDEQVHKAAEALRKYESDDIRVLEVGCWNHIRNLYLRGMTKKLSTLPENTIRKELD